MRTHPPPQTSTPESSAEPAQPSPAAPPSGPEAVAGEPAREATLFHLLVERGWSPEVAYTADQRIHTMTSGITATALQPVLEELRQMRENMATKADLVGFATKADLVGFATRADLAGFATKADLQKTETYLLREMAERETRLIKWLFGAMLAQTAVIVGFVLGVAPLLK